MHLDDVDSAAQLHVKLRATSCSAPACSATLKHSHIGAAVEGACGPPRVGVTSTKAMKSDDRQSINFTTRNIGSEIVTSTQIPNSD